LLCNRLTDGTKHTQARQVVLNVMVAGALEKSQRGRSNVELGNLVLVNDIPVPGEVRIRRGTLENERGHAEQKRGIDDIGVTSDPTNVTSGTQDIAGVQVKDVLASNGGTHEVTADSVHDALGLAGGAGSV